MSNTRSNLPESVRKLTIMESRGDAKNADSDSKNSNTGDDITLVSSRRAGNNKVSQHSRYAHKRSFSLGGVQPLRNRSVHPRDGRTTILEQQKKERLLREKAEELVCIIRSGNVSQLGPFLPMIQQIDRLDLEVALVCEAVKSGNETMLRVLLEAGACVSRPDRHFFRPLHYAASTGQTEVVQILLDAGSFVDAREGTGCTPLYYSMRKGYPASSALLLNAKADPTNAGYAGRSAFHAACINTENDHLSCIEILLGLDRALASLNRESEQGKKPVDVCAQYGTLPALKLLLKDDRIVTDWKTLDCAVQRKCGAQAVFRLLLEKGEYDA